MGKRAHLSLKTKLASALLALEGFQYDEVTGKCCRVNLIPYEDSKRMTADQIISLFAFDHYPQRKADGGPDEPWNLEPRLIQAHREKTAKVDVPEMAKSKRIRRKVSLHNVALASKAANDTIADIVSDGVRRMSRTLLKRRIPSRPFPKIKRPMRRK